MREESATPVSSPRSNRPYPEAANRHTAAIPERILKVSLESARLGSVVVLHCHDHAITRNEGRALASLIAEVLPSARRMVLDLSTVDSLDSGALSELVMIHMWAEAAGYALPFASPSDSVRGLFESTNLVSVFDLYASVEAAVAAMQQEQVQTA